MIKYTLRLYTLLFLVSYCQLASTQNILEDIQSEFPYSHCHIVLEISPEHLLLVLNTNIHSTSNLGVATYIMIISRDGQILKEIQLPQMKTGDCYVNFMGDWLDDFLVDIELLSYPYEGQFEFDQSHQRFILQLNNDFEIIRQDSILLENGKSTFFAGHIDEHLYVSLHSIGDLSNDEFLYCAAKKDETQISLIFSNNSRLYSPSDILTTSDSSQYLLFSFDGIQDLNVEENNIQVDLREKIDIHHAGHFRMSDENNLYVHGIKRIRIEEIQLLYQTLYKVFDQEDNLILEDTLGLWPDGSGSYWNYPAIQNSIEYNKETKDVFAAGNLLIPFNFYTSNTPTSFYIAKYKEGLDRQWYHIFGMDANYWIMGITATNDGGCMVYGWRRDPDTGIRYPYLLKLNEDGLTTSTSEATLPPKPEVMIYGNPSSQLTFEVLTEDGWNGKAYLIDMNGRLIHQENLTSTRTTMNTMSLSAGTYMLLILDTYGRVLTQEKWVKVE